MTYRNAWRIGRQLAKGIKYGRKYWKSRKRKRSFQESSSPRYKRTRSFRRKSLTYRPGNTLKDKVRELSRLTESEMGTHIYKQRRKASCVASVNSTDYGAYGGWDITTLETALSNLRYFDSSTGTLVNVAGATGTFQKEFFFKYLYSKVYARNNYQVPCEVTLYIVCPKDDTGIKPDTAFTNGLSDVGNPSSTSTLLYPTDSPQRS